MQLNVVKNESVIESVEFCNGTCNTQPVVIRPTSYAKLKLALSAIYAASDLMMGIIEVKNPFMFAYHPTTSSFEEVLKVMEAEQTIALPRPDGPKLIGLLHSNVLDQAKHVTFNTHRLGWYSLQPGTPRRSGWYGISLVNTSEIRIVLPWLAQIAKGDMLAYLASGTPIRVHSETIKFQDGGTNYNVPNLLKLVIEWHAQIEAGNLETVLKNRATRILQAQHKRVERQVMKEAGIEIPAIENDGKKVTVIIKNETKKVALKSLNGIFDVIVAGKKHVLGLNAQSEYGLTRIAYYAARGDILIAR